MSTLRMEATTPRHELHYLRIATGELFIFRGVTPADLRECGPLVHALGSLYRQRLLTGTEARVILERAREGRDG